MPPGTTRWARAKRASVLRKRPGSVSASEMFGAMLAHEVLGQEGVHRLVGTAIGLAAPLRLERVRRALEDEERRRLPDCGERVVHSNRFAIRHDGVRRAVEQENG